MFRILAKEELSPSITKLVIEAAAIAKHAQAGQFISLTVDPQGERIPLTLADWDKDRGTITLIFQRLGFTTKRLGALTPGQTIAHILGPLGYPTPVQKIGAVICIGGGVGIAEVWPVSRAFKQAGNRLIGIIGARNRDLIILERQMRGTCDELYITTEDGSYGSKGLVTDILKKTLAGSDGDNYGLVYAIGPVMMMKTISEITRPLGIKTTVSLNPIMVDATGMCGSCRCTISGKTVFACVDGPDFDGHQVDFDELQKRLRFFTNQEKQIDAD